jgi:hypothetical protein
VENGVAESTLSLIAWSNIGIANLGDRIQAWVGGRSGIIQGAVAGGLVVGMAVQESVPEDEEEEKQSF